MPLRSDGTVVLLLEDVTEERRVDAVRRDFVANVSHELKTPVGAMHLLAEAIVESPDDIEMVTRFATRMTARERAAVHLVQELIDLSRLQGAEPMEHCDIVEAGRRGRRRRWTGSGWPPRPRTSAWS